MTATFPVTARNQFTDCLRGNSRLSVDAKRKRSSSDRFTSNRKQPPRRTKSYCTFWPSLHFAFRPTDQMFSAPLNGENCLVIKHVESKIQTSTSWSHTPSQTHCLKTHRLKCFAGSNRGFPHLHCFLCNYFLQHLPQISSDHVEY